MNGGPGAEDPPSSLLYPVIAKASVGQHAYPGTLLDSGDNGRNKTLSCGIKVPSQVMGKGWALESEDLRFKLTLPF